MSQRKEPKMAVCHPTLPAYAKSLCRRCYDSKRWTRRLPISVSSEARRLAEEAAGKVPRADRKDFESSKYARTDNPAVANFVAGAIVQNFMDVERAVEEIKPDLSPVQIAETAQKLQADPNVKAAIEKSLEKRGLDEASKAHFVSILWRFAESPDPNDEKKTLAAWRILGRGFIGEKLEVDKPVDLPIKDFDKVLKGMGIDEESLSRARLGPVSSPAMIDDDEDDGESLGFDA